MAAVPFDIIEYDQLASTNDEAKRLAEDGGREGLVVHALEQTAGRGRLGRTWVSEPGNLFASLLLRPEVPMAQVPTLPFVAAAALSDTLSPKLGADADLTHKWPNDVLLGGKKISGILLESGGSRTGLWVVVGIGVNLASSPSETRYPATSLAEAGVSWSPDDFLKDYVRVFAGLYQLWLGHGFAPIRKSWMRRAANLQKTIEVLQGDDTLRGTFEDVDETGALCLKLADGRIKTITAGDVFFTD